MPMQQSTLDRIRVLNKRFTNKLLIHIAGKKFGHFVILTHTGRKSGRQYRIPVIAEPYLNGFIIAMTYGKQVDWYENVKAKNGCSLRSKNRVFELINPQFVEKEEGLKAFPSVFRAGLRKMGIEYFLKLEIQP
jgi:deazaflavin-dependent oxidoreductase (nitroreductase family)